MKMKKIAAILTALSVFSGCAGNTGTEEAATTTGTTEAVMVETTTTTTEVVAEAENTEVAETTSTTERDMGWHEAGENGMPEFNPDDFAHLITKSETTPEISEENETNSAIVDEVVEHIELTTYDESVEYTEIIAVSIIRTNAKLISHPLMTSKYFPEEERSENPKINIVNGWGCYPSGIINVYKGTVAWTDFIDLTNSSPEELYKYIDKGTSVMVWVTEGLAEPVLFAEYEGNKMYSPKECVVLAGYSDTAVCVWSVIEGKYVTYDRALFEQRYAEMGSMALTVVVE